MPASLVAVKFVRGWISSVTGSPISSRSARQRSRNNPSVVCPVVGTKTVLGGDQSWADAESGVRHVVSARTTAAAASNRRVNARRYPAGPCRPSPIVFPQKLYRRTAVTRVRRNLSRAHYTHV